MLLKLMGFLDLASGILVLLYHYSSISTRLIISVLLYLGVKAFLFRGDIASFIDASIAIYILLMIFLPIAVLSYIAAIYLVQKGVSSIVG